ncbi:putative sporulation protein YtxC [Paenibacillus larvae]|nr:putative sporulation protein YtxC [Paenibacillus larvae]MDR5568243.1 putative sporulation protein YtxC [Paenibacillus larvae]
MAITRKGATHLELPHLVLHDRTDDYAISLANRIRTLLDADPASRLSLMIDYTDSKSCVHLKFRPPTSGKLLQADVVRVNRYIAQALAEHIVMEEEKHLVKAFITEGLKKLPSANLEMIHDFCIELLNGEGESAELGKKEGVAYSSSFRRQQKLADAVETYLQENRRLHVEGFMRFRLNDYMNDLREVVEYAFEEYRMEQQYQEFIALLKYFVYIQETKIQAVHLIHKGGHEFTILDEQLKPIHTGTTETSITLEMIEKDMNFEDMIVSTLITVSPENIYIHTREPELTIIKTIMQIYEDRTTLCSYCRQCQPFLGKPDKQDQFYP